MEARDFHIGDEVRYRFADGSYGDRATVKFADPWPEEDGLSIWLRWDDGDREWIMSRNLVHASDGAPLGEFVPIGGEDHGAYIGGYHTEPHITVDDANAIITGEAP